MKPLQIRRLVDESHTRDQTHNNNKANTAEDDELKNEKEKEQKNKDANNSTLT